MLVQVSGHRKSASATALFQSNLTSGTAVDLLGGDAPLGPRGVVEADTVVVIRDILSSREGVVAWGGDMKMPQEGFSQIDVQPGDAALAQVAEKIRDAGIGNAPGSIDAFSPQRRQRSQQFAKATRHSRTW